MSWLQTLTTINQRQLICKFFLFCGCSLVFSMLAGCQTTKVDTWQPVRSQLKIQVHTVTWESENLQVISKWYTGDEKNWKGIANANPNIIPSQLVLGDKILIPSSLLKTRAAMTKIFVEEWMRYSKLKETPTMVKKNGGPAAPFIVPKLHKLKENSDDFEQVVPLDLKEPDDDGNDLELFGPK